MNIIKIVVDGKLPKSCHICQFKQTYEMFMPDCSITHFVIYTDDEHRSESCPLVVEDVCEWIREETERGFAAFYIPKYHEQHPDCYTQDAGEYKFCPNCGKRIKYVEVE